MSSTHVWQNSTEQKRQEAVLALFLFWDTKRMEANIHMRYVYVYAYVYVCVLHELQGNAEAAAESMEIDPHIVFASRLPPRPTM